MLLLTEKKLTKKEYHDYLYGDSEPNFLFEEMEFSLDEIASDIFEGNDGSLFTIYNNKINYIYLDYDFYKLFKDSGYEYNSNLLLEDKIKNKKFIPSKKYLEALKNGADAALYKTERDNADYEVKFNKISQDDYEKINKYINDKKELALKLLLKNKTNDIEITSGINDSNGTYSLKADYNSGEHKIAVYYLNINKYKELAKEIIRKE